jgi:hypothetical protein
MQGQSKLCTGDPHIDGNLPRLMQTVWTWQETHKDPSMVSKADLCEFMNPKCVWTYSQGFRCVHEGSDMFTRVWTCSCGL